MSNNSIKTAGNIYVYAIGISDALIDMEVGKTANISAIVSPSNATNKKVKWSSSNTNVATVIGKLNTGNATITAKGAGTATITAAAQDGSGVFVRCIINVFNKITVISCSPSTWVASSQSMGQNMLSAYNDAGELGGNSVVVTPNSALEFETYWSMAGECLIIHTHGSPVGLFDHGEDNSTPLIISKDRLELMSINNNIKFIMMTACSTAGGTVNDNVAYWLSKKINPNGIVIANSNKVSGGSINFGASNGEATWKVYRNGSIVKNCTEVYLTMSDAYNIYQEYHI